MIEIGVSDEPVSEEKWCASQLDNMTLKQRLAGVWRHEAKLAATHLQNCRTATPLRWAEGLARSERPEGRGHSNSASRSGRSSRPIDNNSGATPSGTIHFPHDCEKGRKRKWAGLDRVPRVAGHRRQTSFTSWISPLSSGNGLRTGGGVPCGGHAAGCRQAASAIA